MNVIQSDGFLRIFFNYENFLHLFVYTTVYCVSAEIGALMSISDGLGPFIFRRKMENTLPIGEEIDRKVFISRQSWHVIVVVNMEKVLVPIVSLTWPVKS